MEITCQHIAANCNPMPQTLQFLDQNTIAYCFSNQIGIYDVNKNRVLININNRSISTSRANCLKCIQLNQKAYIIVGYDSGHLCIYEQLKQRTEWKLKQTIKQATALTFIHFFGEYIITGNTSAEIYLYQSEFEKQNCLKQLQILKFPLNKIAESVVTFQQNNKTVIFIGGVDQKIHCYLKQKQQKLSYKFSLAGHENAITKLTIVQQDKDYLLASGSKDGYIRLWKITKNLELIKFHKNIKQLEDWRIFLDSVLISHECSVTNLCWTKFGGTLRLVSCSLDCTICVWGQQGEEAWSVDSRMGQFLGNKNAYFNVITDPQYTYLVAVNYIGSAMIWVHDKQTDKFSLRPAFNGHTNEVRDIDWNHSGDFLVSVSMDQTTRIISPNSETGNYHEISRAQIHGYDINAVSTVKIGDGLIDLVACGADEKVIRIVEPPACFANFLNSSTKVNLHLFFPTKAEEKKYTISKEGDQILLYQTYAEGGTQVLGLMTKMHRVERQKITSYYEEQQGEDQGDDQQNIEEIKDQKINFKIPPHDDYLIKHTLWPEMNKLYGHPHEISCLAKCNQRKLLASSCSGLNKIASMIIIWNTEEWKIQRMIEHHQYTVYDMKFSNCGNYLVSVSKDRKLAVFDKNFEVLFSYQAHSRAATSVSFSQNGQLIATGSRDKSIKIHSLSEKKVIQQISIKKPVFSVQFCGDRLLAGGLQDGTIIFIILKDGKWEITTEIEDKYSHSSQVTSLKWLKGKLASCGKDNSVRIFNVKQK